MSKKNNSQRFIRLLVKGCLLIAGVLTVVTIGNLFSHLMFPGEDGSERQKYSREKAQRQKAFSILRKTVHEYYEAHKNYPTLDYIHKVEEDALQKSLVSNSVRYYRRTDSEGEFCYVIEIIDDVRTNWSGRRISNKPECIDLPKDSKPTDGGTYYNILDLH